MNYLDDNECKKIISLIAGGSSDKELTAELAKFRTPSADAFWGKAGGSEKFADYFFEARSDTASDIVAAELSSFLDRALEKTAATPELCTSGWYLLCQCHYKQSPRLINVYRRIAANWKKLRRINIQWSEISSLDLTECPYDFLKKRAELERQNGTSSTFLGMLCDIVILTMWDSFDLYGDASEFAEDIRLITEQYPDTFIPVQLYHDIANDSSRAYDEWMSSPLISDEDILYILGGLTFKDGKYQLFSPFLYSGADNRQAYFSVTYDEEKTLDRRWLEYLAERPFEICEKYACCGAYYSSAVFRKYSEVLCRLTDSDDPVLSEYFRKSAVTGGTISDFLGLFQTGFEPTEENLTELYRQIAQHIVCDRQKFVFTWLEYALKKECGEEALTDGIRTACRRAALEVLEKEGVPDELSTAFEKFRNGED